MMPAVNDRALLQTRTSTGCDVPVALLHVRLGPQAGLPFISGTKMEGTIE